MKDLLLEMCGEIERKCREYDLELSEVRNRFPLPRQNAFEDLSYAEVTDLLEKTIALVFDYCTLPSCITPDGSHAVGIRGETISISEVQGLSRTADELCSKYTGGYSCARKSAINQSNGGIKNIVNLIFDGERIKQLQSKGENIVSEYWGGQQFWHCTSKISNDWDERTQFVQLYKDTYASKLPQEFLDSDPYVDMLQFNTILAQHYLNTVIPFSSLW